MPTYAKVFARILDSTIANNWWTRHLFEDLLKLATWEGEVDLTPEAIARRTGWPLSLSDLREHLAILEAPDPDSRTPEEEGRRIVRLDPERSWGWRIVNFPMYRDAADADRVREQTRIRVQRHREKRRGELLADGVTTGNASLRHEDGDEDRDRDRVNSSMATAEGGGPAVPDSGETAGGDHDDGAEVGGTTVATGTATFRLGPPPAAGWTEERQDAFGVRWGRYPRKEKKDRAFRGWTKTVRSRADIAAYDLAESHYLPHAAELEPDKVMQGGTWFGGRWREWVEGNPVTGGKRSAGPAPGVQVGGRQPAEPTPAKRDTDPRNAWAQVLAELGEPAKAYPLAGTAQIAGQAIGQGAMIVVGVETDQQINELRERCGPEIAKARRKLFPLIDGFRMEVVRWSE